MERLSNQLDSRSIDCNPPPLLSDLQAKGIDLYLHQQGIATTTPAGKAMFHPLVSTDPAGRESREELKAVGGAYR